MNHSSQKKFEKIKYTPIKPPILFIGSFMKTVGSLWFLNPENQSEVLSHWTVL
jgi:hypothetical protein